MSELCFSGHKIDVKDATPFYTPQASYMYIPHVRSIELALHSEYKHPSSRERARQGALQYDVDLVYDTYWKPVLADIEKSINEK